MCKPTTTITAKVEELMELRKMIEGLQAEAEAITDEIKTYMRHYQHHQRKTPAAGHPEQHHH